MNILIVCGETSSNLYGVKLANALIQAGHNIFSVGDAKLALVSCQILSVDSTAHSIYFGQGLRKIQFKREFKKIMTISHKEHRFDKVVIVDFPGYNFMIADIVQAFNIPIVTFISPNFWIWKQRRQATCLVKYSESIITIFKQEYEFFRLLTDKVHYFGHPLTLDFRQGVSSPITLDAVTIGVFPGSRHAEILLQLPKICRILLLLKKYVAISINIECSDPLLKPSIQEVLERYPNVNTVNIVIKADIMSKIDLAISVPGTNTLKLALLEVPMIIVGMLKPMTYFIAKHVLRLKVPFIALPNTIAERCVCPEYIQHQTPIKTIVNDIVALLKNPDQINKMLKEYQKIKAEISAPADYYQRLAAIIQE